MRGLLPLLLLSACASPASAVDVPLGGSASAGGPAPERAAAASPDLVPDDIPPSADVAMHCPGELASGCERVRKKDWRAAQVELRAGLTIGGKIRLFHGIAGNVLLGRASSRLGDGEGASGHYAQARALWATPAAEARLRREAGSDEGAQLRELAGALGAVGEALFHGAEELRMRTQAKTMASEPGVGSGAAQRHASSASAWLAVRMKEGREAEDGFAAVLGLQPVPPPYWVVVSANRVALLWGNTADEARKAPVPASWGEEQQRVFRDALEEGLSPVRRRSEEAYRRCAALAERYQVKAAAGEACRVWVQAHPLP